jgi:hypothetical protein
LNSLLVEQVDSFGELVRYYRRQSRDPMRGGLLTQERLGELIGVQMGDAGYSGAAVSEWERNKSKIHADDRLVLLSLLSVLILCGGVKNVEQANALLAAGNYRRLNSKEYAQIFHEEIVTAGRDIAGNNEPGSRPSRQLEQKILLDKVHSFWVEGVLQKSLQGVPLFTVPQTYSLEAVDHPWNDHLGPNLLEHQSALPLSSIYDSYLSGDKAILILGYPGSGKTTLLITLAQGMIERAWNDITQPVPILLDLASWSRMQLELGAWVVEELAAKYQIPRRYGREWTAKNKLILLLDGLDTLPLANRGACIQAINDFRQSNGLTGIVVSSRIVEYEQAGQLLKLNRGIALHPLKDGQLADYLARGGDAFLGLAAALETSVDLYEMAHNPLMLNIMTAVFCGTSSGLSEELPESQITLDLLFDAYVERMFGHHAAHEKYSQNQTLAGLSWLAAGMDDHNQSIFLIEQLQPSWLPNRRWRRLYMVLAGAITGLTGGLIMWLLWQLLRHTLPQLPAPTSEAVAGILGIPVTWSEPLTILLGNLALGLLVGITLMFLFEARMKRPAHSAPVKRQHWRQVILIGFETGLLATLFVLPFSEPLLALAWGVAEGFMYAAAGRYIFGWSYQTEIRTVEALGWSWSSAFMGVLVGLGLAMISELIETLLYGYNGVVRTVITLGVAGFVLGGLRGRSVETKSRPNQGVWLSLRNALIAATVLALTMAALAWIIRDPLYAWQIGVLSAVIAASILGGSVFVKHFLLRAMFRYQGTVPWRYADFLDHASHLVLMRKVGNGYIFVHGLLQTYFVQNF